MADVVLPYNKGHAITTSDTVDIPQGLTDAINVGAAGTVTVVWQDGTTAQLTAVAGAVLPLKIKRVNASGTAATGLIALYYR